MRQAFRSRSRASLSNRQRLLLLLDMLSPQKRQAEQVSECGVPKMTKEELREYRSIKKEICQIERRIADLATIEELDITHPLRELYRQKLADLIECQLKIEKAIESLNSTERELMRLRYIDGEEWLEVSEAIHYEWTQTHRIHAKALAKIKNL